jgi:hypothetical protein
MTHTGGKVSFGYCLGWEAGVYLTSIKWNRNGAVAGPEAGIECASRTDVRYARGTDVADAREDVTPSRPVGRGLLMGRQGSWEASTCIRRRR